MIIIIITNNAPPRLRGLLTRWLLQPAAGIYVGKVSAAVRDRLWECVKEEGRTTSGALLIHSDNNEQGFRVHQWGRTDRQPVDWEGLTLIRRDPPSEKALRQRGLLRRGETMPPPRSRSASLFTRAGENERQARPPANKPLAPSLPPEPTARSKRPDKPRPASLLRPELAAEPGAEPSKADDSSKREPRPLDPDWPGVEVGEE